MVPVLTLLAALAASLDQPDPVAAAALSATPAEESTAEEATADEAIDLHFGTFYEEMFAGRFKQALEAAERIEVPAENREGEAIVLAMRATALLGLKREKEARELIAEADRLAPLSPYPVTTLFSGGLLTDQIAASAEALDRMIARFPDVVREIDWEEMAFFLRKERDSDRARAEERTIALAQLGYGGDAEWGDYLAYEAMGYLMKRGDAAGASELVPYIDVPDAVQSLLVRKRFAALWPAVERHAGSGLEKVLASSVRKAEQDYAKAPQDAEKLQLLINALRFAGRLDEAIALRSKLPATSKDMAAADEQMGWAVNNLALALFDAGREQEADQLFALLNEAPMEDGGWRVSMIINRTGLLVESGRFERAHALLGATEASAAKDGNDYARQLVRQYKYCVLSRLGRKDEAARMLPDLLDHAADAYAATVDALLCSGELDQAETVALEALAKEEDFEEEFVRGLQPRPLGSSRASVWADAGKALRARPAVAREFERLGRDLPEQFLVSARPAQNVAGGGAAP